jgi:integrase
MAKAWGPVRLADEIQKVRGVFRYAYDANLIDKPVRFGPGFTKPSQQAMRLNRAKQGPKMFEAEQIRALLKASPVQLKAMILLGVNCGFGNGDLTHLPLSALDLKAGWVTYPRPKTGIPRRCPLWPETVAAVAQAIGSRPKPFDKEDAGLAFLTPLGRRWTTAVVTDTTVWHNDALTREFRRLLEQLKLYRPGLGFYALRHTFETVAGDSKDQVAVNAIMGHAPAVGDMSAVYRERISDDRLRAVVDHVHGWLWPVAGTKEGK